MRVDCGAFRSVMLSGEGGGETAEEEPKRPAGAVMRVESFADVMLSGECVWGEGVDTAMQEPKRPAGAVMRVESFANAV